MWEWIPDPGGQSLEQDYDVVVAGCGPIGAMAALGLAEKGWRVLMLEEHNVVGRPVQCGGLVSTRTMELVPEQDLRSAVEAGVPKGTEELNLKALARGESMSGENSPLGS